MNIYINDLSKYYKNKKALDHITLHLSSGIYGLIGPNGAGKTTFLSMLILLVMNFLNIFVHLNQLIKTK